MNREPEMFGEVAFWIAIVVGAGIAFVALFALVPAEVGARLQHGHWLRPTLNTTLRVVFGWLGHPGDPLFGWPRTMQPRLPSLPLLWVLVALEILLALALAVFAVWAYTRGQGRGSRGTWTTRPASRSIPRRHHGGL